MPVTPITLANLTGATLDGTGVFDVIMRANKAHLESEFVKGRIKGTEYATVYLGSLEAVMATALQFLLNKDKASLEAQVLEQQVLLAQVQIAKVTEELNHLTAQTALVTQQRTNLIAEALNIPKQGLKIDADKAVATQQQLNLAAEKILTDGKVAMTTQQTANAVIEGTVLSATQCKLAAEFDVLILTKDKTAQETNLLLQKVVTERAQVTALGVDADSVIGKQKALYAAQTNGFTRDAEQKVAKVMVDSWNVRRTTDEGTVADATNMLNDVAVGRAVNKLLGGVGA